MNLTYDKEAQAYSLIGPKFTKDTIPCVQFNAVKTLVAILLNLDVSAKHVEMVRSDIHADVFG